MYNTPILNNAVQEFITKNLNTNITTLILKGSPFKHIAIQDLANQILAKKKSENKLPTWFNTPQIIYPEKVSIEQTSSEKTAAYKANLVKGSSLLDITGGFGVDSFYFSKQFKNVIHLEINTELSAIVQHNFKVLNTTNITTKALNGVAYLKDITTKVDCIYVDPSRRDTAKGKVFLLEDCLPNVVPKVDFFFTKTHTILIKVSPILDISQTIKALKHVKTVHVVAVNNEVKELLFLLEKDHTTPITIYCANIKKETTERVQFLFPDTKNATYGNLKAYLYEPNAAILKSGCFQHVCTTFNVTKLHQHSHLYTSAKLQTFYGRTFKVNHVLNYDKKKLKKLIPEGKANITTRNFPKTVKQIRKETKLKDGGHAYLFFTTDLNGNFIVIICTKIG